MFELLDEYVDVEFAGDDADTRLRGIREHLQGCPTCREDHESLRGLVAHRVGAFVVPPQAATAGASRCSATGSGGPDVSELVEADAHRDCALVLRHDIGAVIQPAEVGREIPAAELVPRPPQRFRRDH